MNSKCTFCLISKGMSDSYKIYEDDLFLCILDRNPIRQGHLLLITKEHYPYIYQLPIKVYKRIFLKVRELRLVLEKVYKANRIGMYVGGISVPHVHIHMVPIYKKKDFDPCLSKKMTEKELKNMQSQILKGINM